MAAPDPSFSRMVAAQVLEDVAEAELIDALHGMGGGPESDELHRTVLRLLSGFVPREVLLEEAAKFRRAL